MNFNWRRNSFSLVAALTFITIQTSHAELRAIERPLSADGPTRVHVWMGLLDVDEIDSANQNFAANFFMVVRWMDQRLEHSLPGVVVNDLEDIWHPQLQVVNQQKIWNTMPGTVRIGPDGSVEYRQRIWGHFSQPLEVQEFPFDTQSFEIRFASAIYSTDEVLFAKDPDHESALAKRFSLPDWKILDWKLDFERYRPFGTDKGVASFALAFRAQRYASNHVLKIIFPLVMIVAMSWIVFWINPNQSGTQIGVATTSMLTLIAYRFMVGGMMPDVPYLTRMDFFILGSTALVFATLAQAVTTSRMSDRGNLDRAIRIDRICRIAFPVLFVGILIGSFV